MNCKISYPVIIISFNLPTSYRLLTRESFIFKRYICSKGTVFYSKKLHAINASVEALFSNHRDVDQTIPNHVLFAVSPETSMCVVSDDTDIYILMLYIAKHWQLIDGVHVPVWYSSLQLPTQEKISNHQETNCKNPVGTYFENEKSDSNDDMISDVD